MALRSETNSIAPCPVDGTRGRADRIRPVRERGTEGDRHKNEPPSPRFIYTGKTYGFYSIPDSSCSARRIPPRLFSTNISNSRLSSACLLCFVHDNFSPLSIFFNFVVKVNIYVKNKPIIRLFDLFFQIQRFIPYSTILGLI